jgi:hypothetical protein
VCFGILYINDERAVQICIDIEMHEVICCKLVNSTDFYRELYVELIGAEQFTMRFYQSPGFLRKF